MKICFLMPTPFNLGGEQRVVSVISNILVSYNYDVTIMCTEAKYKENYDLYKLDSRVKIEYANIKMGFIDKVIRKFKYIINSINMHTGIIKNNLFLLKFINRNVKQQKEIIKKINEDKYDIVIGVGSDYCVLLTDIKNKINSKLIGWQHSCFEAYFETKGIRLYNQEKLVKLMLKTLDEYIVLTNKDKIRIKEKFDIDVKTIYNPKSFYSDKVCELNNKNFLAAGRFDKVKGYDLLLESYSMFCKKNKDWTLTIVGEGIEKENIISLIKKYNLENLVILDPFTDNIKEYFLKSSVFLLSSRWEGMPMIILESMEMGCPVISYDIDVMQEILGEAGSLVKRFKTEDFANEMLKLADNYEIRKKMGNKAREQSKQFSYDIIGEKWINIFQKLMR